MIRFVFPSYLARTKLVFAMVLLLIIICDFYSAKFITELMTFSLFLKTIHILFDVHLTTFQSITIKY
jgi:hypothetical protein